MKVIKNFQMGDIRQVTYLDGTPNVHVHYLIDDDTADAQGYSEIELCCHACGRYIEVLFMVPRKDDPAWAYVADQGLPAIRNVRDEFQAAHRDCVTAVPETVLTPFVGFGNEQYKMLCPTWRKYAAAEKVVDLRRSPA